MVTYSMYSHDGVSNQRRLHCLLNRLSSRRSKKTSKLRVTGLCEENWKWFHLMTSSCIQPPGLEWLSCIHAHNHLCYRNLRWLAYMYSQDRLYYIQWLTRSIHTTVWVMIIYNVCILHTRLYYCNWYACGNLHRPQIVIKHLLLCE